MPMITVNVGCKVPDSFRVQQCAGMFDLELAERTSRSWTIEVPGVDEDWRIGAIVGPSGSGKTVVARHVYGDSLVAGFDWPADRAVIDVLAPADVDGGLKAASAMLNSVGFSSPPDWVKPYGVLSNGQRFRCDLARSLLTTPPSGGGVVAFDEFSSVVDRQVAQFGSAAVAKTIRRPTGDFRGRFVAVTCHYDILDWLQPDWVLDMASGALARGWLQPRPPVELEIRLAHRSAWSLFAHHHYLNHRLHTSSRCYLGWWREQPIAFLATMQTVSNQGGGRRQAHRLVVLPDYQGLGVGMGLLGAVADHELRNVAGVRHFGIVTSHPALIRALARSPAWRKRGINHASSMNESLRRRSSAYSPDRSMQRYRASFGYVGGGR